MLPGDRDHYQSLVDVAAFVSSTAAGPFHDLIFQRGRQGGMGPGRQWTEEGEEGSEEGEEGSTFRALF